MKKLLTMALVAGLMLSCGSAMAAKVWDDMSWWGHTGATPEPVKCSVHAGYWWYPTMPASNAGDSELWGNRGIIYHLGYEPAQPKEVTPPPEQPPAKAQIEIPVLNNVLFDFDKSTLKPEGKAESDKVVAFLNEHTQATVMIEGHTCNIGTDEYNMALGQRRANAVKDYLVQSGIAESRVSTQSYGESQPAVPNTSSANRKLNRRAVFSISLNE